MNEVKDYPPYLDYPKPRRIMTNADRKGGRMTRSTQRDERGAYLAGDGIYSDWDVPEKYRGTEVDRLASYEDTGLDPEEIERLKRERDAAIEDCSGYCESCQFEKDCAKHDMNGAAPMRWYCGDCEDWEWRGVQKEEK